MGHIIQFEASKKRSHMPKHKRQTVNSAHSNEQSNINSELNAAHEAIEQISNISIREELLSHWRLQVRQYLHQIDSGFLPGGVA